MLLQSQESFDHQEEIPFDLEQNKEKFLFIPLGGAAEIGMNLNLYYYAGKWLLVDFGISFPDDRFPGATIIFPKIDFIEQYRDDIVGLVLTHPHEDHIGAAAHLWSYLRCPIYTTRFTAHIVQAKFNDLEGENPIIHEIFANTPIDLSPFNIELVGITHSTLEMKAVCIKTDVGIVLHTGDWSIDDIPVVGAVTDIAKLKQIGDEGVLALVCDSTNIFNKGHSRSEGELSTEFISLMSGYTKNLIVVTTFASNIARIYSIAQAARKHGRKVALIGRSLLRMYDAARSSGYLEDLEPFIDVEDIDNYPRNQLVLICTGCQGEILAAVNKIACNNHQHITLEKDDVIIFSSKIIPGNEKRIFALMNKFCLNGIKILCEHNNFVHVSGHPCQEELKLMYGWTRPQIVIPVHGEPLHLDEHCKFAIKNGIKHVVKPTNGSVIELDHDHPRIIGSVYNGYLALDGKEILEGENPIFRDRSIMKEHGIVVIFIIINGVTGKVKKSSRVINYGLLDRGDEHHRDIITEISKKASIITQDEYLTISNSKNMSSDKIKDFYSKARKKVETEVRKIIYRSRGKSPKIYAHIEIITDD